ncbi:ABC transporter permease [Aquibacillus kalidii]|uniref:ABC transporter permease n=1 Tax=Aquibacillus kalidii TaxID=2762597 RepID=UPI001645CD36|nr:ABC transporter permease subunit [Aquibacillus kalidii]
MFSIGKREFISLFKGIKSIVIIAILLVSAYYSTKLAELLLSTGMNISAEERQNIYTVGIQFLILLFGQLFVMGLSHDVMNKELHERTIRFLVSRVARSQIVIGKFLGIWLFWLTCLFVSFLIVCVFAQTFDIIAFLQLTSLLTYQISLTILLSVLVPKPGFTMFLGILVGIAFPILIAWVTLTSNVWVAWMRYITPFYYIQHPNFAFLTNLLLSCVMLIISIEIFKRRDC